MCLVVWITPAKTLFCTTLMNSKHSIYSRTQAVSAIFMILALLWLTVSTPFVFNSQQVLTEQLSGDFDAPLNGSEEDNTNPFGNNTEEKNPNSGSSFSEEYLHDNAVQHNSLLVNLRYHKCCDTDTYVAFHGELLVPPPNHC